MVRTSFDVLVIGAGFSGSILGGILAKRGLSVAIVDPIPHPRFAIGESSTPMADLILADLGETFQWPLLKSLSSWGSWQKEVPELAGGMKRGFTYFHHEADSTQRTFNRLVIEASHGEEKSDTHWLRADVDHRLFQEAITRGATSYLGWRVMSVSPQHVTIHEDATGQASTLGCKWVVDASGRAAVAARSLGWPDQTNQLRTKTSCRFAHLQTVKPWSTLHADANAPFNVDDAAQHHLLGDEGWAWLLRMNNGTTSVGLVDRNLPKPIRLDRYPVLNDLLGNPDARVESAPFTWNTIARIQHRMGRIADKRILLLPTAAATIDPLHSTGIAHALIGVERITGMILDQAIAPQEYVSSVDREIDWIDQHISIAYSVMPDFERFKVATMIFVLAAIVGEESRQRGVRDCLYSAGHAPLVAACNDAFELLLNPNLATDQVRHQVAKRLDEWNVARLFHDSNDCYPYTAGGKS